MRGIGRFVAFGRSAAAAAVVATGLLSSAVRADGLPGEYLLSQRWRDLHSKHSPLTNPAFLTEENYPTIRFAFAPVLQGAFKLYELGVTLPLGLYQSVGLSLFAEDDGHVSGGYFDENTGRVTTVSTTRSNRNAFLMASYAIHPVNRLSVGANLTFAYQTNFDTPIMGLGLDLGASYRLIRHPVIGDHVAGISTINLLPPSMSTSVVPQPGTPGEYARGMKLSWFASFMERVLESGIDFDIKDIFAAAEEFSQSGSALETARSMEWGAAWRLGVWLMRVINIYLQVGLDETGGEYWGLAGGMNLPSINNGRDLALLYQYNIKAEGDRASSHTMYVRANIGSHREEMFARRVNWTMDASPNDLYNRALNLYHNRKYWEAFFVFGRILTQFPEFFKNDWVSYYLRSCQEFLDIRDEASGGYRKAIESYAGSEMVPHADLGIMRIAFRDDNREVVRNQYEKLTRPGVPDSLRFHALYLMGQTHLRDRNYFPALQAFESIPETHPEYIFAQHSRAVVYFINNNSSGAVAALENAVQAQIGTPRQREMVNRSLLFLGLMFYEEQSLSKAVGALRGIPATSYYYEEALLGLAWAAVKARQWHDCLSSAQTLVKVSTRPVIRCEGLLLQAYSFLMRKEYPQALMVLSEASRMISQIQPPSEDTLVVRTRKYQNDRLVNEGIGSTAYDLALAQPSETVKRMVDSLYSRQVQVKGAIDEHLRYEDEFVRNRFFSKTLENLRVDIEYALATAEKISGESITVKQTRDALQKGMELEKEIGRIKEEMERLEKGEKQ